MKLLSEILGKSTNVRGKRSEHVIIYLNESKKLRDNFESLNFTFYMQNRQGTPEFVEEFTRK